MTNIKSNEFDSMELLQYLSRIESLLYMLALTHKDKIIESSLKSFGKSKKRAEIYFALDGKKTTTIIAEQVKMKLPNVSVEIGKLIDNGIIEHCKKEGKRKIYRRTPAFEMIGFDVKLRTKFGLKKKGKQ